MKDRKINESKNCSVVISSCDSFCDVWEPFFKLFFKYWSDCPYEIYLISNFKKYESDRVINLRIGADHGWASNLRSALKLINSSQIILILEDMFLEEPVPNDYIKKIVDYTVENDIGYLRLMPEPMPDEPYNSVLKLGKIRKDAEYRVSLQASLWKKSLLDNLLVDGENAWEMEIKGTKRSNNLDELFLSTTEAALHYHPRTGIIRGEWMPYVRKLFKQEGISVDLGKRGINYRAGLSATLDSLRKSKLLVNFKKMPVVRQLGSFILYRLIRPLLRK